MRSPTRARLGLGAVAGLLLSAGLVGVPAITASGSAVTGGGAAVPYGTLTVDLRDRAGTVTLTRLDGAVFSQPLVTRQPCATLDTEPIVGPDGSTVPGRLVELTPSLPANPGATGMSVQLPSNAIGVHQGENCGGPAGLVGPGERLAISLGDFAFPTGTKIRSGSLAIGKTHPQDGNLRIAYDGAFETKSIPNAGGTVTFDNKSISSIWIESTATQNSRGLSLRSPTTLDLVVPSGFDQDVFCEQSRTVRSNDGDDLASAGTFARLLNGDKSTGTDCDDIGVTIRFNTSDDFSGILWDNGTTGLNTGSFQDVRALFTIEWKGLPADQLTTFINYDGNFEGPFFEMQWCTSYDAEQQTAVMPEGPIGLDAEGTEIIDTVPWCLVSNTEHLGPNGIDQTQVLYGAGDPAGIKRFS